MVNQPRENFFVKFKNGFRNAFFPKSKTRPSRRSIAFTLLVVAIGAALTGGLIAMGATRMNFFSTLMFIVSGLFVIGAVSLAWIARNDPPGPRPSLDSLA